MEYGRACVCVHGLLTARVYVCVCARISMEHGRVVCVCARAQRERESNETDFTAKIF